MKNFIVLTFLALFITSEVAFGFYDNLAALQQLRNTLERREQEVNFSNCLFFSEIIVNLAEPTFA